MFLLLQYFQPCLKVLGFRSITQPYSQFIAFPLLIINLLLISILQKKRAATCLTLRLTLFRFVLNEERELVCTPLKAVVTVILSTSLFLGTVYHFIPVS